MNEFEYEETLKDYRREGRDERSLEIAKALLAQGVSMDIITSVTGVSAENLK